MSKGLKKKNHWTSRVHEIVIVRNPEGQLGFELKGGAENGQFPYLGEVKPGKVAYEGGSKLVPEELLLEVNETPVAGLTIRDVLAVIKHCKDPIRLKCVKQGSKGYSSGVQDHVKMEEKPKHACVLSSADEAEGLCPLAEKIHRECFLNFISGRSSVFLYYVKRDPEQLCVLGPYWYLGGDRQQQSADMVRHPEHCVEVRALTVLEVCFTGTSSRGKGDNHDLCELYTQQGQLDGHPHREQVQIISPWPSTSQSDNAEGNMGEDSDSENKVWQYSVFIVLSLRVLESEVYIPKFTLYIVKVESEEAHGSLCGARKLPGISNHVSLWSFQSMKCIQSLIESQSCLQEQNGSADGLVVSQIWTQEMSCMMYICRYVTDDKNKGCAFIGTSYSFVLPVVMTQVLLTKPDKEFRSVSRMQRNGAAFQALRNVEQITQVKPQNVATVYSLTCPTQVNPELVWMFLAVQLRMMHEAIITHSVSELLHNQKTYPVITPDILGIGEMTSNRVDPEIIQFLENKLWNKTLNVT
ncbi:hypothetical protein Q9966_006809 [Columba livia]|nr:hypothetical protein Q9966_006809 [Columba livia]